MSANEETQKQPSNEMNIPNIYVHKNREQFHHMSNIRTKPGQTVTNIISQVHKTLTHTTVDTHTQASSSNGNTAVHEYTYILKR